MNAKPWDARLAARLIRPFIASRRIHPNHFTALRLVVGVAGAFCFASAHLPNAAAALVVLSNFLDHTDGELARVSGKTSRFGHYFDLASDAIVTIGTFVGIGIGLDRGGHDSNSLVMGAVAGLAVALIFFLRDKIEQLHGKTATRQPRWAGFEAEDVLYLMPLVTLCGGLEWFMYIAAVGAPLAFILVAFSYLRVMRVTTASTA